MTELTLELPPEVYRRLNEEAARLGKPPHIVAEEWLAERLTRPTTRYENDREKARQALREAGLLTEIGPHLRELADPTVHLEEINAALDRAGGKKLGVIILEQRGPKG
jgi:predicted transcriptional regulator